MPEKTQFFSILYLVIERVLAYKSGTGVSKEAYDVHNSNSNAHRSRREGVLSSVCDHRHPKKIKSFSATFSTAFFRTVQLEVKEGIGLVS